MNEIITSLQNPQVKLWRGLNKSRAARVEAGLFLAEGEHMVGEAIKENKARALLIEAASGKNTAPWRIPRRAFLRFIWQAT